MEALIGEYEVTYEAEPPLLVVHHLTKGRDVLRMSGAEVAAFCEVLAEQSKRIRPIASYQIIFGGSDDLSFYLATGGRACYMHADQVAQLRQLLGVS